MTISLLAASLSKHPGLLTNIQYQLTGLLVVVFTLGLLALVMSILGKIFVLWERSAGADSATVPVPVTASPETAVESSDVPEEAIPGATLAVIAAAVSTALSHRPVIIHRVHAADPRENLAWGAEGRRSIYAGKNLR